MASLLLLSAPASALEFPLYLSPPVQPCLEAGVYDCPPPSQPAVRATWQVLRDYGETDFSCGNSFGEVLRTPDSEADAFARTADHIRGAKAEVLLTTMEWHPEPEMPGYTVVEALRDLYAQVQATPSNYPDGMQVALLLGNFPDRSLQHPSRSAVRQTAAYLAAAGVPLGDPSIGWSVRLGVYDYVPHSHVKLHVIDGESLSVSGYNYGPNHLKPIEAQGIEDFGLTMRGPVAKNGMAVFADLWAASSELVCVRSEAAGEVFYSPQGCGWKAAGPLHHAARVRNVTPTGDSTALMLYRRHSYPQAEDAHLAFFGAAKSHIDLWQTSLSAGYTCFVPQPTPTVCADAGLPVYYTALLEAMGRGVRVRALIINQRTEGLGNRSGIIMLRREAKAHGVADLLEVRATNSIYHGKVLLVDDAAVLVGSMNLQVSAWGPLGLAETALLTDDAQAVAEMQARFEEAWAQRSHPFNPYGGPSGDFVEVGE